LGGFFDAVLMRAQSAPANGMRRESAGTIDGAAASSS
jgi:hypothetical protein